MEWRDRLALEELAVAKPLPASFYTRPTVDVARDLLGKLVVFHGLVARIVETEAYLGCEDSASHAAPGPTARNAVMFGPPGVSYVYFIYGMYFCLNAVAHPGDPASAGAVLIRAAEPLRGLGAMRERRSTARRWQDLASGPGKLTRAFGIGRAENGISLVDGPLRFLELPVGEALVVGVSPRIGIRKCADWPLRFFATDHPCVTSSPLNRAGTPALAGASPMRR
ncbi:MAG: DNA-3-methyladenine glycosylase [Bryobacterales bacterium]|nr:DNA-3-methyladenine glycosylase [Bryobacterales bacterium]